MPTWVDGQRDAVQVQKALGGQAHPLPLEDEPEWGEEPAREKDGADGESRCPPRAEGEGGVEWPSKDCFPMHRPWVHDPAAAWIMAFAARPQARKEEPCFRILRG